MNTDGTGFNTRKECHKIESLRNHTTTDHKEGEQLEDRRNLGESSCNFGDGTDQRVQPMMLMMMMMMMIGEKISKKNTAFRRAISVQERLALTLRFLASGDLYVSLQYLFKIYKQEISCIVPEVCEALVEKLKDYIQVRQILLFVVYKRSLKLDCNQNFYLNTNFTETLVLKTGQIILHTPAY